jgi:hypothetical protein
VIRLHPEVPVLTQPIAHPRAELTRHSLGDARLDCRLGQIADALEAKPTMSFPKVFGSDAATEAFYRFMANAKVSWGPLLDSHVESTHQRCVEAGAILAIHDTTLCQFGGDQVREGAFRTAKSKSGFLAHTALAVSADGSRRPLGLLGMIPVVRLDEEAAEKSPGTTYANESARWLDLVAIVDDEVPTPVEVIHVMDSEGDAYDLLEHTAGVGADFVVRLCHDRRVATPDGTGRLGDALDRGVTRLNRTVRLTARKAEKGVKAGSRHAARDERTCRLEARVLEARVLRPAGSEAPETELSLNVVHVVEVDPPEGQHAVSWVLATTLPIETAEQVARIVDAYRARWLIEEWFKALKTGCAYESRQLESLDALLVAFALLAPIATRLLVLRWLARDDPQRPADDVLSADEIACLRIIERRHRRTLPEKPTVHDAMLAIAKIGGFLTRNKVPGWQVLGRGFEEFLSMFSMYQMMRGDVEAEM